MPRLESSNDSTLNLDTLVDFVDAATSELLKFRVTVTLSPERLLAEMYVLASLDWDSIRYGREELDRVPENKRGIYAFVICHDGDVLPPHGYILYIGIAGYRSGRSLRDRYKDYLNVKRVRKRVRIARMIGTWNEVLRFFFAPVDDSFSSDELKALECQLNTALMPPFSVQDIDAATREQRRAFP